MAVLERYNAWLDSLTEEQRRYVLDAPDAATRLARIRDQRLREWLPRLPTREQEAVGRLPADQQPDRIATFRFEERRQRTVWHRDWQARLAAIPKPTKMSELPPAARAFVEANVVRHLTTAERKSLAEAEGKYPDWLRQLLALSEKHPVLPPGPHGRDHVTRRAEEGQGRGEGGGEAVGEEDQGCREQGARDAGPSSPWRSATCPPTSRTPASRPSGRAGRASSPRRCRCSSTGSLFPALGIEQRTRLDRLQGQWPEYPYMLHELARQKRLVIPGMSLPGPVEMWEGVRAPASP